MKDIIVVSSLIALGLFLEVIWVTSIVTALSEIMNKTFWGV